ncbi:hypothetical protein A1O3_07626 [Capronia epimyces CBS 606.96]|uniref:Uncharacterized protein n=1 Tax=Capronia epimyces CBS 606.96 TaxID=1182542 RepID=W9XWJ5_9EURO|nr:uncharacterized protein A1O3_07626 [Capronia epimyces CBS 606.96]EXJ81336.1 hypothetical protein A1O3_07626 [Capronia epimyces CBS 606.96]
MSNDDDYPTRPHRDRDQDHSRYGRSTGLRFPDEDNYASDSRRPAAPTPRHSRYDVSPPRAYGSDESRLKKDLDPRDAEPKTASRDPKDDPPRYREYPTSARDNDVKPKKSNTAAPRRRSFDDDAADINPTTHRHGRDGGGAAYGRSKGYREDLPDPEPIMSDRYDPKRTQGSGRRPPVDDDGEFEPEPPRRAKTYREPDHHRRRGDDVYDDEPRASRRYRSPEDRHSDRDRGYRSDGRDARPSSRRDGDRYADRRYRSSGADGYASDRGHKRSDRDRDRDRDGDRDRRDRDRDRDRDRHRDRSHERRKKKGFSLDDIGKVYEQSQKHYKTVAPLVSSLAKMYLDNKK